MSIARSQVKPSGQRQNFAESSQYQKPYCLITGFDAFAANSFNTSQAVVELLPEEIKSASRHAVIAIDRLILPTCGDRAWQMLRNRLERIPRNAKSIVILTGLASKRSLISFERFALNLKDYRIKDNFGHIFSEDRIEDSGPEALRTALSLDKLVTHLRRRGLPSDISNYCGTFVCNETYYRALRFQKLRHVPSALVFVHLPLPSSYGKTMRKNGSMRSQRWGTGKANQLLAMQTSLIEVAKALCQQLISEGRPRQSVL
jgi:pyroglutamyl-peptidase